jgi:hypothetical protein
MSRSMKVEANTVIIEAKAYEASVPTFYFPPPAFLSDT